MASNSSPKFPSEPENSLQERLVRSIWLHGDKYCYLFEPDGSYRLLSTDRQGQYTLLPDGRSVLLAWTTDPFTEELQVLEDGSLFMSGRVFVEIGTRSPITEHNPSPAFSNNPDNSTPSTPEPVYLELSDGKSHKFYEVTVDGLAVTLRYGRIGTPGQTSSSTYSSPEKAQAAAQKKINEKLKKGYGQRSHPSGSSQSTVLPVTLQAGDEMEWQLLDLRVGSTVEIVAISSSVSFSFNLMAGKDFAYHFNPRFNERQIVQNTHVTCWGQEERLFFPQEMALDREFTLTIKVQETDLAVALNGTFLCHYRHRIPPMEIDALGFVSGLGSLQVLSVKISESALKNASSEATLNLEPDLSKKNAEVSRSSDLLPQFSSQPKNSLQEKLIRSIWLQNHKYPYVFQPDGSCEILSHSRRGRYTLSADGRSAVLTWIDPTYTEELRVLEDGSLFLGGGILVEVEGRSRRSSFPCYPLPQPDTHCYRFEMDTGKWPDYGTITLEGLQVRLIRTDWSGNFISEDLRAFQSPEEAEDYYHLTILGNDPYYSPGHINEPIYLELSDAKSHKFYEVTVNGLVVTLRYGRIGTPGQTASSTYGSPRKALAAAEQKINEKLTKGYVRTAIASPERLSSDLEIAQFVRSAWKPIVTQGDGDLLASKFCGRPWLAANETWPTCPCCSKPMQLFLQLNLAELPQPVREEFGTGLLQMFHCAEYNCEADWKEGTIYYGSRIPYLIQNIKIRLVQPLGNGSIPPLPQINGSTYGSDFPALTITDWVEIEDYPELEDLVAQVYGWERASEEGLWDEAVQRLGLEGEDYEERYPVDEGDKLGGYPRWVQGMECPGCPICQAAMRPVFQFASCENLPYMFGDMGIAHILQCPTHQEQFAFVWSGC